MTSPLGRRGDPLAQRARAPGGRVECEGRLIRTLTDGVPADPLLKAFTDKTGMPAGGDREQARDIDAGRCDIALGNTYCMALLAKNEKNPGQQAWANAIRSLFPDAAGRGTHINISGIALTKHAPKQGQC